MTDTDDLKLVKKCLGGNTKAFEVLIEKYQRPIFNTALRMLSNDDDAKDVTQVVFIKAFEKLDTFNPKYKFFSWVYKMTINESINLINQKKNFEELNQNLIANEKTPEEDYSNLELSAGIQDAIMELQIDYRVAIVLRHFADLTYREMSYVLEIPEKTVKSRLFSARRLLNNILLKRGIISHD